MAKKSATASRKDSHMKLCLEEEVEYTDSFANGFGQLRFEHDALCEVSKNEIDLSTHLFGKKLKAPLIIGAMTGGTDLATKINQRLAIAAEKCGIGMALGSQRKLIEDPKVLKSYAVKEVAPNLPLLFGNIGAVQLNYGVTAKQIQKLVKDTKCDAFNFHLNPLQEAIQPEGNTNFKGLLAAIEKMIPQIGIPVLLKEVGSGISMVTAEKIAKLSVAGVETAGAGGTSWSKIESLRTKNSIQRNTGELFARWGIPTAQSILACRQTMPDRVVIASGGIRNGIEIAKAIALGADAAALALPILKAANKSTAAAVEAIEQILEELRVAMFLIGAENIGQLRNKDLTDEPDLTALGGTNS